MQKKIVPSIGGGVFEGLMSFKGLTYRGHSGTPFQNIHYYSKGVDDEQASRFLNIIESVTINQKNIE
jgi:hypothetical protein